MASGFSLADQLFNAEKVSGLAARFAAADPSFDAPGFCADVTARLTDLELKARMSWIAECLTARLPGTLSGAAPILRAALPPPLDPTLSDDDFGDFIYAPLGEVVGTLGLEEADADLALDLLCDITQRFSMEWAIRPFLIRHTDLTLARLADWAGHPNYHVRRLVSEGTRPRLPWGQSVGLPVETALPLLDALHADPTRYVTRSVANHLGDVAKVEEGLVHDRLDRWQAAGAQTPAELKWMTAHALRVPVKNGSPAALARLGFDPDLALDCTLAVTPATLPIGAAAEVSVTLQSPTGGPALVDYAITFAPAAPGGKPRRKVFKLKQVTLKPGRAQTLTKRHSFKGNATTFRLHPGPAEITVQINGRPRASAAFDLTASAGA